MPQVRTLTHRALVLLAASLDSGRAQDVILSEVGLAAGSASGWIELHNRSAATADVSAWALYLATATPGQPQTYWWGFRPGTTIGPGGFLLVRWLAPVPATPVPGEIATGDTLHHFLFGLGAEPLPPGLGALALLRSQQNAQMNSPAVFVDWVGWGGSGLPREPLAEQAGVWVQGHATPALPTGTSLARHPGLLFTGNPEQRWFLDASPTPGSGNVGAASVSTLGTACAPIGHHLLGTPVLLATSAPVLGNAGFALRVRNTTGVLLEHCLLVLTATAAPGPIAGLLPPAPGDGACAVLVDPSTCFHSIWMHTSMTQTDVALPLHQLPAQLAGVQFAAQALVFDNWATAWPPYQGLSNAIVVTLGQ